MDPARLTGALQTLRRARAGGLAAMHPAPAIAHRWIEAASPVTRLGTAPSTRPARSKRWARRVAISKAAGSGCVGFIAVSCGFALRLLRSASLNWRRPTHDASWPRSGSRASRVRTVGRRGCRFGGRHVVVHEVHRIFGRNSPLVSHLQNFPGTPENAGALRGNNFASRRQ
jgi:hypothetical protein